MHDRGVQRAEARFAPLRVGALFEEEVDERGESGVRRHGRRTDAPGIGVVRVRARGDEQPCRLEIADASGEHQRGVAAVRNPAVVFQPAVRRDRHHLAPHLRSRVNIRAVRQQHLDDIRVCLRDRPHQRGLPARAARVHVRVPGDQLPDDIGIAGTRGSHQRRLA